MTTLGILSLALLTGVGACSDDPALDEGVAPPSLSERASSTAEEAARRLRGQGAAAAPGASALTPRALGAGEAGIVHLDVDGVGRIAVRVQAPPTTRYPEGAPVVVVVPPYFTPAEGFTTSSDAHQLGFVSLTLLWPGRRDRSSGTQSAGTDDYGGPDSLAALAELARYGAGQARDVDGATLSQRLEQPVQSENLGLYAFSHPGMAATRMLVEHGASLGTAVDWFVGHENPTSDALCAVEAGHWGADKRPVENPHYKGVSGDSPRIDYSSVRWLVDADHPEGTPVLGTGSRAHVLADRVPGFYGKRTYSAALTRALRDTGALTARTWPSDVSTPEEAAEIWAARTPAGQWGRLKAAAPDLKVLLVFSARDHVQPSPDLPHIQQAYAGFHETAGLWTRLNPDRAYVVSLDPDRPLPGDEHDANTAPRSWSDAARTWGHPARGGAVARTFNAFAALAEMADRTRADDWRTDLSEVLHQGPLPSPPSPGGRGGKGRGQGATATVLTGSGSAPAATASGPGSSASSSGSQSGALQPGAGEVLVAFAGNFEGGSCTKTARRGCDLHLATLNLSTGAVGQASKLVGEPGLAEDSPAMDPRGTVVLYQTSGQGPPELRSVSTGGGSASSLVSKARHPVLDATGGTLAYNTDERAGRGKAKTFDLVRRSVDTSSSPPRLGPVERLTEDGVSTEPILLPDGHRVATYRKSGGERGGRFELLDLRTGGSTDLGMPTGCAHPSLSPSGSLLMCQQGYAMHGRAVDTESLGAVQQWSFPRPSDPDLDACEQVTYGHPEFCGDDSHVLTTYSCKVGGELQWARLMVFELGGEVTSLFSEQVASKLGASGGMARSGVCTPLSP